MKISYAVDNLRSIETMEPIELRPITILVGANNSGKSTFLRSFLLFRQSIEEDTSGPIFWTGSYTDFGDYCTSVKSMNADNEISFKFTIEDFKLVEPLVLQEIGENVKSEFNINQIHYNFNIKLHNNNEYISEINLVIDDLDINFKAIIDDKRDIEYYINDISLTNYINENVVILDSMLFSIRKIVTKYNHLDKFLSSEAQQGTLTNDNIYILFAQNLSKLIIEVFDDPPQNIELLKIYQEIMKSYPLNEHKLSKLKNDSNDTNNKAFYESLIGLSNEKFISEVNRYCAVYIALKSIIAVQDILESYFKCTRSIGPLRVQIDRFNRYLGFNVSEISVDGKNLPMILVSLEEEGKLDEFSNWVKEIIGYEISIRKNVGTVSIFVKHHELSININDSGAGISQILPVLAQIWLNTFGEDSITKNGKNKSCPKFAIPITMEQPELHLHPWHQAELAEAFANVLRDKKIRALNPHFIIETHSEVLINKLGSLIRDEKLSFEDLQIVMFSKKINDPETTQVTTSSYDEEGILNNWPYGFFNY